MKTKKRKLIANRKSLIDWIVILVCFIGGYHFTRQYAEEITLSRLRIHSPQAESTSNLPPTFKKEQQKESETRTQANPIVPQIISPLSGAQFISNTNAREEIELRWKELPAGLKPEIELQRQEDSSFSIELYPSQSGVFASLPDGRYTWRIRTTGPDGQHSNWSNSQDFTIQEILHNQPVIALSKGLNPARTTAVAKNQPEIQNRNPASSPPIPRSQSNLRPVPAQRPHPGDAALAKGPATRRKQVVTQHPEFRALSIRNFLNRDLPQQYQQIAAAAKRRLDELSLTRNGELVQSPATTPIASRLGPPEPNKPSPNRPSYDALYLAGDPILFKWEGYPLTTDYEFQLARDRHFIQLVHQETLKGLLTAVSVKTPGTYFWRIRGLTRGTAQETLGKSPSEWSSVQVFHVR